MFKVYTGYHGTSEIEHGFTACTLRLVDYLSIQAHKPCPEVIKLLSCSTQLSMNFCLLINVKMPIVGILTFMSGKIAFLAYLSLKKRFFFIFILMSI